MGDAAYNILKFFHLTEKEPKTYTTIKDNFDNHFIKKHDVATEHALISVVRLREKHLIIL